MKKDGGEVKSVCRGRHFKDFPHNRGNILGMQNYGAFSFHIKSDDVVGERRDRVQAEAYVLPP